MDSRFIKSVADIRKEYCSRSFTEKEASADPFNQFNIWFEEAIKSKIAEPTAMTVSTVSIEQRPSSRILLLKEFGHDGFSFYTNYESRKGQQLENNPFASILFFWTELERQVRIEGKVRKLSREKSIEYFKTRPRQSQIGAWVSKQSSGISFQDLISKMEAEEEKWKNKEVECPPYWGGYILEPDYFEFWQGRPARVHDRIAYSLNDNKWQIERLSP